MQRRMQSMKIVAVLAGVVLGLSACSQLPWRNAGELDSIIWDDTETQVPESILSGQAPEDRNSSDGFGGTESVERPRFSPLTALPRNQQTRNFNLSGDKPQFGAAGPFELAVEDMPLLQFVNTVFGDLLRVSYVVDDDVKRMSDRARINLNLQQPLQAADLFKVVKSTLNKGNFTVTYKDNIYFIHRQRGQADKARPLIGIGRRAADVPKNAEQVLQVVPVWYGLEGGLERSLTKLLNVKVTANRKEAVLLIEGPRREVLRAVQLVQLLDVPARQGKHIGLMTLTYLEPQEFITAVSQLLNQEGIPAGNKRGGGSVAFVPLERLGAVAIFSINQRFMQRTLSWAEQIDVPGKGNDLRYFLYFPQRQKAVDLGESLGPLLTSPDDKKSAANAAGSEKVSRKDFRMVVDERQNALIFHTTAAEYQRLLPMLKRLDRLPSQVVLEVTIAEVTLTGSLQYGLQWFLQNGSSITRADQPLTLGNGSFNYAATDATGDFQALLTAAASQNRVKILSSPRVVVRDGDAATINVGTQVPILTSTVSDPSGSSLVVQQIQYRNTGVTLSVTPTVNAQGVVSLSVSQNVSEAGANTLSNIQSPVILQRSISTTILARDSQTVVLGGLISENESTGVAKVPLLGDLPIIGGLFRDTTKTRNRTELVVLMTPRILDDLDDLDVLRDTITGAFDTLQVQSPTIVEPTVPSAKRLEPVVPMRVEEPVALLPLSEPKQSLPITPQSPATKWVPVLPE